MSKSPRVNQRTHVGRGFTKYTYRKAFPYLQEDFEGRCAYSMRHVEITGDVAMHIDHFDPREKSRYEQRYRNLKLATDGCNIAKGANWPNRAEQRTGARFIDPAKERDYGVHIFEDPVTHELIGVTPAGIYQILICNLNAPHLVIERRERTHLRKLLKGPGRLRSDFDKAKESIAALRRQCERMIPPIPPPPAES